MRSKSDKKKSLVPRLRFPEFREAGAWEFIPLEAIAPLVNDRVQLKDISNVNYVSTENILQDFGGVAVANKLPTVNSVSSFQAGDVLLANIRPYLKKVWAANFSGGASNDVLVFRPRNSQGGQYVAHILKNNRFINYVMAGAKGVKMPRGDINSIKEYPVPIPPETTEQQKVAHCLSSLDEVIGLQAKKVQSLKQHKKGLMQQLFPAEGETTPRLRFPDFREAGAWEVKRLGEVCDSFSGGTPTTTKKQYYGGSIPFIRSAEIADEITELFLTDEGVKASSAKIVSKGDVLVALYGANSGDVALSKISGAINQAILCLRLSVSNEFIYHYLTHKKGLIIATYIQGGQGNLSGEIVCSISIGFPDNEEQQKIAHCLSSLDEVIGLESHKLDALKNLKKGLMQQLFPQEVA